MIPRAKEAAKGGLWVAILACQSELAEPKQIVKSQRDDTAMKVDRDAGIHGLGRPLTGLRAKLVPGPGGPSQVADNPTVPVDSGVVASPSHSWLVDDETGGEGDLSPFVHRVFSTKLAANVYAQPVRSAAVLGYVRLGSDVGRKARSVVGPDCPERWHAVQPRGYLCGADATMDEGDERVQAAGEGPRLDQALPYRYGQAQQGITQYARVPELAAQKAFEPGLEEQLLWFARHKHERPGTALGANDVPVDANHRPALGERLPIGFRFTSQLATEQTNGDSTVPALFLSGASERVSQWKGVSRGLVSGEVEVGATLAFLSNFSVPGEQSEREFLVTPGLQLTPSFYVHSLPGSLFHGLVPPVSLRWPFAMVTAENATTRRLEGSAPESLSGMPLPLRVVVPLSGALKKVADVDYYQTERESEQWVSSEQVALFSIPSPLPQVAEKGEKWVDLSLSQRTLVLYQGAAPQFATLLSPGPDTWGGAATAALGVGERKVEQKHITAAVGAAENAPWVIALGRGVALHGVYWHDEFGREQPSGSLGLSPVDARYLFEWTEPAVPRGWHGVAATGTATTVLIRP